MAEERKGFSFLKSYYEMLKRLPDSDSKVEYIMAICEKQFEGKEPTIEGMAEFAYASQKHNIDKSRKGWEDVQKRKVIVTPSIDPSEGGSGNPSIDPSEQEEEKEEEKEKEETNSTTAKAIDFDNLVKYINDTLGREFRVVNAAVRKSYKARFKEGYLPSDVFKAINNCKENDYHKESNYQYCTPEFFSRSKTLDKYSTTTQTNKQPVKTKEQLTYESVQAQIAKMEANK